MKTMFPKIKVRKTKSKIGERLEVRLFQVTRKQCQKYSRQESWLSYCLHEKYNVLSGSEMKWDDELKVYVPSDNDILYVSATDSNFSSEDLSYLQGVQDLMKQMCTN